MQPYVTSAFMTLLKDPNYVQYMRDYFSQPPRKYITYTGWAKEIFASQNTKENYCEYVPCPYENIIMVCKKCNLRNEYAVSNQSDGSYICYECR